MAPRKKFVIEKDELVDLYTVKKKTMEEIAELKGCSLSLVWHYRKKFCIKPNSKIVDLVGRRFGILTVVKFVGMKNRCATWECECDCGNKILISSTNLKKKKSCGCLGNNGNIKHGMSSKRPYNIWRGMRTRCDNKNAINYHRYGGRGIAYCKSWKSFERFWEDMALGYKADLTLDRIDNDQGYYKENCRWVTPHEQNLNMSSNHILTENGVSKTITEWAEDIGVKRDVIFYLAAANDDDSNILKIAREKAKSGEPK